MTVPDKPNPDNERPQPTHLALYQVAVGVISDLMRTRALADDHPETVIALRRGREMIEQYQVIFEMVRHS